MDRAQNLETGAQVRLKQAVASPAVAPGILIASGVPSRTWRLPEPVPERGASLPGAVAPAATDGARVVIATGADLQWLALGARERHHLSGEPAPWYPPAVAGPWIAWVGIEGGAETIWLERDGDSGARRIVAGDHPRHVVAQGGTLAWITDSAVVLMDLESGEQHPIPADAHTSRSLALWGGVACWEAWAGADIDVICSDGAGAGGAGQQRQPSRWGDWLLYRSEGRVMVTRGGE